MSPRKAMSEADGDVAALDAAIRNSNPHVLTVWSDIGCPWATLALHTLRSRAAERNERPLIDHRAFPLELFNTMPTPKFILDPELVAIAGLRPEVGWVPWQAHDATYPVTTLPALEAVQAAKQQEHDGLQASDALDAALRHALYVDSRCISLHGVILDVARQCPEVDVEHLSAALEHGKARAAVFAQWRTAGGDHLRHDTESDSELPTGSDGEERRGKREPAIKGSPHLFTVHGFAEQNPGATFHWTTPPPQGFPRLDAYDTTWADAVLATIRNDE